jgi:integrase
MPDGKYLTTRPAFTANGSINFKGKGRIKPSYAKVGDEAKCFDSAVYVLRYMRDGKPTWESVGPDANEALATLARKNHELTGVKLGIVPSPQPAAIEAPAPASAPGTRRLLSRAVADYLEEKSRSRMGTTLSAYKKTLTYFRESCAKEYVEDIERADLLRFQSFLSTEKKNSPRSIANKFLNLMIFLKAMGLPKMTRSGDWPTYVEETPEVYKQQELDAFFAACNDQERLWFEFFLMSGMRDQEVMHCMWRDVDFEQGTISVTAKSEFKWKPKRNKERSVPVPASLLENLIAIRPTNQRGLIFPNPVGNPRGDFLMDCKEIARRADLDPADWYLHKFRATFCTMHLRAGVDLRTVQAWMGHATTPAGLRATMRYLRPAEGREAQAKANATFAAVRGAA